MNNTRELEIEVHFNLALAIGGNPNLFSLIDEIVSKGESKYYNYYKNSRYNGDMDILFKYFPLKFHTYFIKAIGIIERARIRKDNIHITQLLRKGYPQVFNYMTTNRKITTEKVRNLMIKYKPIQDYTDFEVFSFYSVVLYFGMSRRVEMRDDYNIIGYINRFTDSMTNSLSYQHEKYDEITDEEKEFMDKYLFSVYKKDVINPSPLLDLYVDSEVAKNYFNAESYDEFINTYLNKPTFSQEDYLEARSKSFRDGKLNSLIGLYASVLRTVGFHESFSEQPIPYEKLIKAVKSALVVTKLNNINDSEQITNAIVAIIFMLSIQNQYEEVLHSYEELYKKSSPHEQANEIERLQEQLEASKHELDETKRISKRNEELTKSNHEVAMQNVLKELESLKKENQRLTQEVELKSKHDGELVALRNYIFNQEQTNEFEELQPSTVEQMTNTISKLNIAVIGGHINWLNKMKEVFPSFRYINIDKQRDLTFLNNSNIDCIVYNTATNNHGVYEHITETLKIDFTKFMYLNGNYNLDISIKAIYDFVNKI